MSEATSTLISENEDCDGRSGATQPSTFESASINQTVVSSDNVTYSDSPKSTSVLKRISRFLTVEPMLFLHMLAWSSLGVNTQYFYIERICQWEFPDMDCKNMTANETAGNRTEIGLHNTPWNYFFLNIILGNVLKKIFFYVA